MKRRLVALLLLTPLAVLAQTYPSPGPSRGSGGPPPPSLTTTCVTLGTNSPVTISAIDTTGATILIFRTSFYAGLGVTSVNITDNKGNGTATNLTVYKGAHTASQISYKLSPTVGAGHTFTVTAVGGTIYAAAFCVSTSTALTAFDSTDNGLGGAAATCQTGAISPGAGTHMVVGMMAQENGGIPTVDSGMIIDGSVAYASGTNIGVGGAHLYQAVGASINPTFSSASATESSCSIASFH